MTNPPAPTPAPHTRLHPYRDPDASPYYAEAAAHIFAARIAVHAHTAPRPEPALSTD